MNSVSDRQKFLLGPAAFCHQGTGKISSGSAESSLLRHLAEFDGGLVLLGGIAQKALIRVTEAGGLPLSFGPAGLGRHELRITGQEEHAGDQERR